VLHNDLRSIIDSTECTATPYLFSAASAYTNAAADTHVNTFSSASKEENTISFEQFLLLCDEGRQKKS